MTPKMGGYAGSSNKKLRVELANAIQQAMCLRAKQQSQNHHIHTHRAGAIRKAMEREKRVLELHGKQPAYPRLTMPFTRALPAPLPAPTRALPAPPRLAPRARGRALGDPRLTRALPAPYPRLPAPYPRLTRVYPRPRVYPRLGSSPRGAGKPVA